MHALLANLPLAVTLCHGVAGKERSLLMEGTRLNRGAYERLNIPHCPTGSLYIAWSAEELAALDHLATAHSAGHGAGGAGSKGSEAQVIREVEQIHKLAGEGLGAGAVGAVEQRR